MPAHPPISPFRPPLQPGAQAARAPKLILTHRYRLLPTRQQHAALDHILEDQRRLYNRALAARKDHYAGQVVPRVLADVSFPPAAARALVDYAGRLAKEAGVKPKTLTYFDQTNALTKWRQSEERMREVPTFLQHWTLKRLEDAYKAFFRRAKDGAGARSGFPRFRSKYDWRSFGFSQNGGFRIGGNRAKISFKGLPGYESSKLTPCGNLPGGIRIHLDRPLPRDIGELGQKSQYLRAVSLTKEGRVWYLNIMAEAEPALRCQSATAVVGIDVGITAPIVQSDGVVVPLPAYLRGPAQSEHRRAQRALSRCKRRSKRRAKVRDRLARLRAKETRIRKQWAHVQSARLARNYAGVAFEDLALPNMTRSAKGTVEKPGRNVRAKAGLNREMLAVASSRLRALHGYKCQRDGSRQWLVDPRYTSQTCSGCGTISADSRRSQSEFCCVECRHEDNADRNAAQNQIVLALTSAGVKYAIKGFRIDAHFASAGNAGLPLGGELNGEAACHALENTEGESSPEGASNEAQLNRVSRTSSVPANCSKRRPPNYDVLTPVRARRRSP